jgi:hypothetical protein
MARPHMPENGSGVLGARYISWLCSMVRCRALFCPFSRAVWPLLRRSIEHSLYNSARLPGLNRGCELYRLAIFVGSSRKAVGQGFRP